MSIVPLTRTPLTRSYCYKVTRLMFLKNCFLLVLLSSTKVVDDYIISEKGYFHGLTRRLATRLETPLSSVWKLSVLKSRRPLWGSK